MTSLFSGGIETPLLQKGEDKNGNRRGIEGEGNATVKKSGLSTLVINIGPG